MSSLKTTHLLHSRPRESPPNTDIKEIIRGILVDGVERVLSYGGTGQYNRDGTGTSACGLAALNFARIVFAMEQSGLQGINLLQALLARECAEETTAICALWSSNHHLEVEDICRIPLFERTLKLKKTKYGRPGFSEFKSLLTELNNLDSSAVVIITRPPEIVACLKLQLTFRNVFIIFDSHPRPSYPNGAGMIANTSIEGTAHRLSELLPSVDLLDSVLQWQAQLLSNYSGHVFVPHSVEGSTPTLLQTILEFSLAQLSMRGEISELRSQNVSLKNDQQRLESKIKETEARSQFTSPAQLSMQEEVSKLRAEISELRSQNVTLKNGQQRLESEIKEAEARSRRQESQTLFQQQQFGLSSYFDPSSSSPSYFSSSTRHTSRPSSSKASASLNPFSTSNLNPFSISSTLNPFSTSAPNPFRSDSPSATKSSSGRAPSHSGSPPTPHSGRDDSKFYAMRLQHEYNNKDRALSDSPSATKSSTGRAPNHPSRATHAPTSPSDRDDSILYAMRLQREYDSEDRALSNFPSATKSSSGRAPSHPGRATHPLPTPPSDRDDSILYAMRLQHEFDKEDRALSAERAELAKFSQRLFVCGVCMEEMPYDSVARPDPCGHTFCRECLRGHVTARLDERKFPILCPTCAADKSKGKGVDGEVSQSLALNLGLTDKQYSIWTEIEMNAFSVPLNCRKCQRTMFVARDEHEAVNIIVCPLPDCDHAWCKQCQQSIDSDNPKHSCDGTLELDHLIKEKGWKYCPTCKTPIQKESGCNHMTCLTPACNTHFCYICGGLIVRSTASQETHKAVDAHFSKKCQLFEVPE